MPSYIVKQPNGFFARFSTVVDDFTHLNMTSAEVVEVIVDEAAQIARGVALRALENVEALENSQPEETCKRCLETVAAIHGRLVAEERRKQMETSEESHA